MFVDSVASNRIKPATKDFERNLFRKVFSEYGQDLKSVVH